MLLKTYEAIIIKLLTWLLITHIPMKTSDTPICAVSILTVTLEVQTVCWTSHLTRAAEETLNTPFGAIPSDGFAAVVNTVTACVVTV